MRRLEQRVWVMGVVVCGVIGCVSLGPGLARAADPSETPAEAPAVTPAPPASQEPAAPDERMRKGKGKGKGERQQKAKQRMKEACGEDVKKFCPDVKPGEGRIAQCLEQHRAEVSQPCQEMLEKRAARKGKNKKQ